MLLYSNKNILTFKRNCVGAFEGNRENTFELFVFEILNDFLYSNNPEAIVILEKPINTTEAVTILSYGILKESHKNIDDFLIYLFTIQLVIYL